MIYSHLLPAYNSTWLPLNNHILSATKVQPSWSKCSRFRKIIHDGTYFFCLKLQHQHIYTFSSIYAQISNGLNFNMSEINCRKNEAYQIIFEKEVRNENLREGRALSPNGTVLTDDCSSCEMVAINIAY